MVSTSYLFIFAFAFDIYKTQIFPFELLASYQTPN